MDALTPVWLALGIVSLVAGGEALVRGGGGLGRAAGLSSLVVGLTVVAFATSAPELAVTVDASLAGSPGLAVGNVVGSNIANILLVIGLSAVVMPLTVGRQVVRAEVPFLVAVSGLAFVLMADRQVSRFDGAFLVLLLAGWVTVSVVRARRVEQLANAGDGAAAGRGAAPADQPPGAGAPVRRRGGRRVWRDLALVGAGVAFLVVGARAIVSAATDIAVAFGVSDLVVGLTVVAIGTSLPEIATSVVATVRGEREMALGNAVGSSAFNLGAVLGLAAAASPGGVPVAATAVRFDVPIMLAVTILLLPLAYTGSVVSRWEGGLLLACYASYLTYVVLDAAGHDLSSVDALALRVVLPAFVAVLAATSVQHARRQRALLPRAGGR